MIPVQEDKTVDETVETENAVESQAVNYSTMTLSELKSVASDKGLKYNSKISKSKLITMLEEDA